ncbi:MAG TPA: Crp/Fnr family transcriptional regulator [Haloplasmataceae bacterium]
MHKDYLKNFHATFFNKLFTLANKKSIPYLIKSYNKNQIIALANEPCTQVGIITKGEIRIEHLHISGNKTIINTLKQYDIFGEILIFSNESSYPFDIISNTKTDIFFITKLNLLRIFTEDINLMEQFLNHISSSYLNLNKLIKLKSQKTIESKLAYYFLYFQNLSNNNLTCNIKNKTYLADILGVERQSLLRVLKKLQSDNCIIYNKKEIKILNLSYFRNLIE